MHLFFSILFAFFIAIEFMLLSYRYFQVIQLGGYTKQRFFKNIFYNDILTYVFNITAAASSVLFYFLLKNYKFISLIDFFVLNTFLIFCIFKTFKKTPLKLTKRMIRQIILFFILCFMSSFFCFYYGFFYIAFLLEPVLFFIALLSMYIILPIENLIKLEYKYKAVKKLEKNKTLIKIGITGSYGKTAVKNILHKMLEKKYNVLSTPKSYNTPMGVAMTILESLTLETEIFICEMGARYKGDIKELCNMVKPAYALINTIGSQHLETFKNFENIKNEKFELAKAVDKLNGVAFFSGDNETGIELYEKFSGNKFICNVLAYDNSLKHFHYNMDELSYGEILNQVDGGSEFILYLDGFKLSCRTKLLGSHNINNIALAAAVAYKLEVSIDDIKSAIENLESAPHRLEIIKGVNGITVIDDSFNSNILGFQNALEVLKGFYLGRKVLVTPGVVELGKAQYAENLKLTEFIFSACDFLIIVGNENAKAFEEGLKQKEFKNYILVKDLPQAQEFLKTYLQHGDTVLFENDLPDNY